MGRLPKIKRKGWEIEKPPTKKISADEEKETIIRITKLDNKANIYSSDKPTITLLKKNKDCTLIREDNFGAEFEIDKEKIEIHTPKRVRRSRQQKETGEDNLSLL